MKNQYLSLVILLAFQSITTYAQRVDTTFNPTFLAETSPFSISTMADGKILAGGSSFSLIGDYPVRGLARLLPNGAPDTTFSFDKRIVESPRIFTAQADQRVVIAGHFTNQQGEFWGNLLRLNANGSLDTSFTPLIDTSLTIIDFEILPNQKIFLAYKHCEDRESSNCINGIQLLDKDGKPDAHFPTIEFTANEEDDPLTLADIDLQSNNELLVLGSALQLDTLVQTAFRFDSLGILDPTFNPVIPLEPSTRYLGLGVAQNGDVAVLSSTALSFNFTVLDRLGNQIFSESRRQDMEHLIALNNNEFLITGDLTTRIYRSGRLLVVSNFDSIVDVAQHLDGILFVGSTQFKGIKRYLTIGNQLELDLNFKTLFRTPGTILRMDLAKEGKLILSRGFNSINNQLVGPLARLNPDGTLDKTFSTLGVNSDPRYHPNNFDILSDGKIVLGSDRNADGATGILNGLSLLNEDGSFLNQFNVPSLSNSLTNVNDVVSDSKGRIYIVERRKDTQTGEQIFLQYEPIGPLQYEVKELTDSLTFAKSFFMLKNDQLMTYGSKITGFLHPALLRYNDDGTIDASFDAELPSEFLISHVFVTKDLETFISGSERLPSGDIVFPTYKLFPNGQRDLSFSPSVEYKEKFRPSIFVKGQLPNGLILVTGPFKKYNGVATPSGRILIDRDGEFIQEFLPETEGSIIELVTIDEQSVYLSGRFETPNGTKSLIKVIDIPQLSTNTINHKQSAQIELFPNPAFGQTLNLRLPSEFLYQNFDYSIVEAASGRSVQNGQIEIADQNRITLPPNLMGAYLIQLKNAKSSLSQKLLIQN